MPQEETRAARLADDNFPVELQRQVPARHARSLLCDALHDRAKIRLRLYVVLSAVDACYDRGSTFCQFFFLNDGAP